MRIQKGRNIMLQPMRQHLETQFRECMAPMLKKRNGDSLTLASHQPDFFPWMGYFYKIYQSDVFVFSDNVQYSKSGRHNYNHILTGNGPMKFTLPVSYHAVNLDELQIAADEFAISKMLKTIRQEYSKASRYDDVYPVIERLFHTATISESLADFNMRCIMKLCDLFGLRNNRIFFASSSLPLKQKRDARIIEMCEHFGATAYFSGEGAKDYHIDADYKAHGIDLIYSDYEPLIYPQVRKRSALNMSVIDYVFNCGFVIPKEWNKNE